MMTGTIKDHARRLLELAPCGINLTHNQVLDVLSIAVHGKDNNRISAGERSIQFNATEITNKGQLVIKSARQRFDIDQDDERCLKIALDRLAQPTPIEQMKEGRLHWTGNTEDARWLTERWLSDHQAYARPLLRPDDITNRTQLKDRIEIAYVPSTYNDTAETMIMLSELGADFHVAEFTQVMPGEDSRQRVVNHP